MVASARSAYHHYYMGCMADAFGGADTRPAARLRAQAAGADAGQDFGRRFVVHAGDTCDFAPGKIGVCSESPSRGARGSPPATCARLFTESPRPVLRPRRRALLPLFSRPARSKSRLQTAIALCTACYVFSGPGPTTRRSAMTCQIAKRSYSTATCSVRSRYGLLDRLAKSAANAGRGLRRGRGRETARALETASGTSTGSSGSSGSTTGNRLVGSTTTATGSVGERPPRRAESTSGCGQRRFRNHQAGRASGAAATSGSASGAASGSASGASSGAATAGPSFAEDVYSDLGLCTVCLPCHAPSERAAATSNGKLDLVDLGATRTRQSRRRQGRWQPPAARPALRASWPGAPRQASSTISSTPRRRPAPRLRAATACQKLERRCRRPISWWSRCGLIAAPRPKGRAFKRRSKPARAPHYAG
jgi:hypothetical protein